MTAPAPDFPGIVATLGTTTDDPAVLADMVAAGMGMGRVNTAYGGLDEIGDRLDALAAAGGIPAMLDLKGPQLRVDCTTERADPATGATRTVPCRYPIATGELICVGFGTGPVRFDRDFAADLRPGDEVLFENGTIRARVADPAAEGVKPPARAVLLRVLEAGSGKMSPRMGANVPGRRIGGPHLTERDLEAIALGVARGVAWYALSFARDAKDVLHLDAALARAGAAGGAGIIPKIEEESGVARLDEIVEAVRGRGRPVAVMIGRGDLFVELPRARLFAVQCALLDRCRALGPPSIVATGLLRSMQDSRSPSRAEVCDAAAAVARGATSLLLSDETSNGKHPALAVRTLAEIARETRRGG